jgi:hypothetical protein
MATRNAIAAGQETLRNQRHAWYGIGMPILFLVVIGFGSRLLGAQFWYYSYATILVMLVFGLLQGMQAAAMTANAPTPWMGGEERIVAYAPMLWFVVLVIGLLRAPVHRAQEASASPMTHPAATHVTAPSGD